MIEFDILYERLFIDTIIPIDRNDKCGGLFISGYAYWNGEGTGSGEGFYLRDNDKLYVKGNGFYD